MTTKQLTVHNASVNTMAIEVKTLTIGARQVTQGIFRQLIEEPLIAEDGTLNGVPWGHVTWHPDKCSGDDHWHIVWQRGEDLRRAQVDKKPLFDRARRHAECPAYEDFYLMVGAEQLISGELLPLRCNDHQYQIPITEYVSSGRLLTDYRDLNVDGIPVWVDLSMEMHAAMIARHQLLHHEQAECPSWKTEESWASDWVKLVEADAAAVGGLRRWLADIDREESQRKAVAEIRAEVERRQRHRDVRATLAQLPQLFIGG